MIDPKQVEAEFLALYRSGRRNTDKAQAESIKLQLQHAALLVGASMRAEQREYFRSRSKDSMIRSKALEKLFDSILRTLAVQLPEAKDGLFGLTVVADPTVPPGRAVFRNADGEALGGFSFKEGDDDK